MIGRIVWIGIGGSIGLILTADLIWRGLVSVMP